MEKQYIEQRDNGYWISGTRVSLESVVLAFLNGLSPEAITSECFPVLKLEQVYGAITYYLSHREEIDSYIQQSNKEYEELRSSIRKKDTLFYEKLMKMRRQVLSAE